MPRYDMYLSSIRSFNSSTTHLRKMSHTSYDLMVIGAGAAGMMCAITASGRGLRTLVLEHNESIGRKILISGGGRCNFTNLNASPENYLTQNPHFPKSALARYSPRDFIALVGKHRIPYHEKKLGQLFCDRSSRDIVQMLLNEAAGAGVKLMTGVRVDEVRKAHLFQVETSAGVFESPALAVACGGLSIPKIGATDLAYRIARKFEIPLLPTRPGLVGLRFDASTRGLFCGLSGVSLPVEASCGRARFSEQALITHKGLSGPAILQISSYADRDHPVQLNLLPQIDAKDWLMRDVKTPLTKRLSQVFPSRFAEVWASVYAPDRPISQCRKEEVESVIRHLEAWAPGFPETDGYAKAEVTLGGVDTRSLHSKTMESRSVPGLYFIGECVDVTGWLGGFNFQWAWASGYAAGLAA